MNRTPMGMGSVLVVEDDWLAATDLASMIEDADCSVLGPVPSVEKALSVLAQAEPAAAFLDENLNGASVAPVAQELDCRGIPFVILSGYVSSISTTPLMQAARRIHKPVSPRQIRDVLADFVSASRR